MQGGELVLASVAVVAVLVATVLTLVLRGRRASAAVRVSGVEVSLAVESQAPTGPETPAPKARITGSSSRAGSARAVAPGGAEIVDTHVHGDLTARVEDTSAAARRTPRRRSS